MLLMLNNVKVLWKTLSLKAPKTSCKNVHWTWIWLALPVQWLVSSQKRLNHQSAHWSPKPVARRRSCWNHFSQSSVWLNWRLLLWPSLLSSELLSSQRKPSLFQSLPSSCQNSCSSRNSYQRARVKVLMLVDFWMLSIASELTASQLVNNSLTHNTRNTKYLKNIT